MTAPAGPRPLELSAIALAGQQIVEASAGTGKTRTITGLVLRLVMERGIAVDRLLVVTYTVAATEELRDRIRTLLVAALVALRGTPSGDAMADALVARVAATDRDEATRRVEAALANFDLAGIHTIHGFCQRALAESAFESALPFDSELVPDVPELRQEVVDDFWRARVVGAPALLVQHLLEARVTPEVLAARLRSQLARPDLHVVRPDVPPDDAALAACLLVWQALCTAWPAARAPVEVLLRDRDVNKSTYREKSVTAWLRRMDAYVRADLPGLKGFERLQKLRADQVARAWKRGATPRTHPVLDVVQAFDDAREAAATLVARHHRQLRIDLLDHARETLAARKREQRVQSFDDLLLQLLRALECSPGGRLAARLRARWAAALVDEFQDTDPVQYAIVRRIWGESGQPLFLVGDPKQAIYRFRGADIYAYLAARGDAAARHDLVENYRSAPDLIAAVNAVFGRVTRPFVLDDIPFLAVASGRPVAPLVVEGDASEPFRVWFLERADSRRQLAKAAAARRAAEATAAEIARLLVLGRQGRARLPAADGGERRLEGGDVAVLVRSHHQGRLVGAALARRGVPSVQQAEDSVFASREAEQLRRVLLAVAEPSRDDILRAALGTELLGVPGDELARLLDDERAWTEWLGLFHRTHQSWREHGFARMFRELLAAQGVPARLLAHPDGERRLTNLLHLGELVQAEAARHPRGLEALVQWMAARAADPRPESEEQQLRLESDEHVVKIVTVHKSKGLQYPVVFCPFVWDGRLYAVNEFRERDVVGHDPERAHRATLEIEADAQSPLRLRAGYEELAETVRLFYVAVTRAIHRCTIVWGATGDSSTAAPMWLLHAPEDDDPLERVRAAKRPRVLDDATLRRDLAALVTRSAGTIRLETLRDGPETTLRAPADEPTALAARPPRRTVARGWRMASFTTLAADRADELPDHDAQRVPTPAAGGEAERTMFTFPSGARAGSCLHAVLEEVDFTDTDAGARRTIVARALRRFGVAAEWTPVVEAMLGRVLATPLDAAGRVQLGDVPRARRLDELEFTYPLANFDAPGFRAVLHATGFAGGPFAGAVDALAFGALAGFMRGFIDLVFEADGRYWLVDYKSNWLGPALEDYRAERLPAVMARESYWLQYLVYTVALHRLLRLRLPRYDYDAHVGGVFYLFLRGMTPDLGAASGVFHDRPSRALVDALDRWVGGDA